MSHALIIGQNMAIGRAIRSRLEPLGFTSFEQVWVEERAIEAVRQRHPDLVVIGEEIDIGSTLEAARRISSEYSVPILLVTGDAENAKRRSGLGCVFEGPFLLNQIEEAVSLARAGVPCRAAR